LPKRCNIYLVMFMAIKNRLKSIRHQHEMNQKEFAEYLGILYTQYNRYETQKSQPTLEIALGISEKLKIPVNDIFYKDNPGY
jgi:putative transcriptional regulator